ncbi:MAG TPA: TAXI family TRAP transporter solute-binding subunit [Bryobacteraceae bacterium]|nr:TAXI family TRAP transporter solute-binding subunit [Bryobacteraceae bacterium]
MDQEEKPKTGRIHWPLSISRISWRDLAVSLGPAVLLGLAAIWIAFWFVRPAPPDTITITSGPDGSQFRTSAERYRKILERSGVTLKILPSNGALENLKRLADPDVDVDVGFVQGGLAADQKIDELVSLGSVFYQPVAVFYRSAKPFDRLSALKGMRVAIGPEGSGARSLALTLLKANGIEPGGSTTLLNLAGEAAVKAMLSHEIDAAFLMGDSATAGAFRRLSGVPGIRQFDFAQADAYLRRFRFLSKIELPPGSIDLGRNLPEKPLTLIATTAELVARTGLHPALSDLLIETAREVHGRGNLLQSAGAFPAPLEHEYPISDEAARYYKSGKGFLYRYLPFWLASLADRTWVVLVPLLVLLIPGLRIVPTVYDWRIRTRIYRRYGELMALERAILEQTTPEQREELLKRVDEIENAVINNKIPGSHADALYVLRQHIHFVRGRLAGLTTATPGTAEAPAVPPDLTIKSNN